MNEAKPYLVLAYYQYAPLEKPHEEVIRHKQFFETRDVACRIYLSEQGINGQMSAIEKDAKDYMDWMHSRPEFSKVEFKIHRYHEQAFPKQTVKYRKNLVAYDRPVDISNQGEHVQPEKWKEMLQNQDNKVLLDVRNDYEWKLGHFQGAELPPCETFRDFETYADDLKAKVDPEKTPVMMYCTGGIRCELYSSILKEKGFEKVFQLHGGIINYGLQEGSKHWLGKLFVFDDRLSVPISEEPAPVIGRCHHCGVEAESYYNCANMDCNYLFLCCPDCLVRSAGCCKTECKTAKRVRPHHEQNAHKPFRKWYRYFSEKAV